MNYKQSFSKFFSELQKYIYYNELDYESVLKKIINIFSYHSRGADQYDLSNEPKQQLINFLSGDSSDVDTWKKFEFVYDNNFNFRTKNELWELMSPVSKFEKRRSKPKIGTEIYIVSTWDPSPETSYAKFNKVLNNKKGDSPINTLMRGPITVVDSHRKSWLGAHQEDTIERAINDLGVGFVIRKKVEKSDNFTFTDEQSYAPSPYEYDTLDGIIRADSVIFYVSKDAYAGFLFTQNKNSYKGIPASPEAVLFEKACIKYFDEFNNDLQVDGL